MSGYDERVNCNVAALSDHELSSLSQILSELIERRIDGIHYAEGRRGQFITIAGAMAALGVALLPLNTLVKWDPGRIALYVGAGTMLVVSAIAWLAYARQTTYPYPYKTGPTQNWKWFYRGACNGPGGLRGSTFFCPSSDRRVERSHPAQRAVGCFRYSGGPSDQLQTEYHSGSKAIVPTARRGAIQKPLPDSAEKDHRQRSCLGPDIRCIFTATGCFAVWFIQCATWKTPES